MHVFYQACFKDKTFHLTSYGSTTSTWLLESFYLENDIRQKWWNIREGDVVIDVGAAYGSYTLTALACGAAKVVFFEPSRNEFFDICTNLMLNHWLEKCLPINALVGAAPGLENNYYPASHSYRPEGNAEQRLVVSIDEVVDNYELPRVDWLKVDTEGAEPAVLQGALATIKKFQPTLLIENHVGFVPGVDQVVRGLLTPLGYKEENITKPTGKNDNWSLWTHS